MSCRVLSFRKTYHTYRTVPSCLVSHGCRIGSNYFISLFSFFSLRYSFLDRCYSRRLPLVSRVLYSIFFWRFSPIQLEQGLFKFILFFFSSVGRSFPFRLSKQKRIFFFVFLFFVSCSLFFYKSRQEFN